MSQILGKISAKLGTVLLRLGPGKRPVSVDRVIQEGLDSLGADASPDMVAKVRQEIANKVLELGEVREKTDEAERLRAAVEDLAMRIRLMETRMNAEGVAFTEAEMSKMKTLVEYGMTHAQVAAHYHVTEDVVKSVTRGEGRVRVSSRHGTRKPRKRALDL